MAPRFQLQDLTRRFEKVLLGSTDIEVHVEGSDLGGMTLELASLSPGPTEVLSTDSPHVGAQSRSHFPTGCHRVRGSC